MALPYFNAIPQATDQPSNSQPDILDNFASLQTFLDVNHVDFASADYGKHMWVTLPSQANQPPTGANFTATEVGLYNSVYAVTGQQELFINKDVAGPFVFNIPATASILSTNASPALGAQGWTYLPSGLIMKWGQVVYAFGAPSTITFPVAATIPAFTQVMSVNLTFANPGAAISNLQIWDYSNLRIRYTGANVAGDVNYFAVGY